MCKTAKSRRVARARSPGSCASSVASYSANCGPQRATGPPEPVALRAARRPSRRPRTSPSRPRPSPPGCASRLCTSQGSLARRPWCRRRRWRPPSSRYISGVVCGRPLFAPVVVRSSNGRLRTPRRPLPPLARNSSIRRRLYSLTPTSCRLRSRHDESHDADKQGHDRARALRRRTRRRRWELHRAREEGLLRRRDLPPRDRRTS